MNRFTGKKLLAAVTLAAAAWAPLARAQFPGPGPVSVTAETPGDFFYEIMVGVQDIDQAQLPAILQQDTATATSVTTGDATNEYQPNAATIASLDAALFPSGGITAQNFSDMFIGFESCAPDCTDTGNAINAAALSNYQGAFQVAQQQAQELEDEGDTAGKILAEALGTPYALTALQDIAGLVAMDIQEQRYQRQLSIAILQTLTTHNAQDLNDGMMARGTEWGSLDAWIP
jgi:hypothetical protein